jgi:hypothetical protein
MFFNFFNKQKQSTEKNEEIVAAITYLIKSDDDKVIIDIELSDYEDRSISGLCKLLDTLIEESCYIETLNMIKSALLEQDEEDVLLKIFTNISKKYKDKLLKNHKESIKDEPCIKPSDMLY